MATTSDTTTQTINWSCPLTPELSAITQQLWHTINQAISKYSHGTPQLWSETELQKLNNYLAAPTCQLPEMTFPANVWIAREALSKITLNQHLSATALFKIFLFFRCIVNNYGHVHYSLFYAFNRLYLATNKPSLLELAQLLKSAGYPASMLIDAYAHSYAKLAHEWKNEDVWPFFAQHTDLLFTAITTSSTSTLYGTNREFLFKAAGLLPEPPADLIELLYLYAFGSAKQNRLYAQSTLNTRADKTSRIIAALSDSKAEVRTQAALWAAKLKLSAALPTLERVVKKEKIDACKAAQLEALQALGQSVMQYLDKAQLAKDAAKLLSKGIPKELSWFPWQNLPLVRWADNQQVVEREVLTYFCVQAVKQKSPEPNALLRKYCSMFAEQDREKLGLFVLEQWIAEDTRLPTAEQALALAEQRAKQYSVYGLKIEVADMLPSCSNTPIGSTIPSKGLLAITAACATSNVADIAGAYLKKYYGNRAAQCRALITMLAWVEHPAAIHLLLAVGNRFRTKSIQEEASTQIQAMAERKGWTLDELADRTIPTAGLEDGGELHLSYGTRSFSAHLLDDLTLALHNPDGKKITALPDPRQDDDQAAATLAKKLLSSAKKELKTVIKLQSERLYEAMCSERVWNYQDWQLYLQQHPIMRLLVQRLIWIEVDHGLCFRPLNDGSLSDIDDNNLTLQAQQRIRLAHESLLTPAQSSAWQQHLVDYEVMPLFTQLGKSYFVLPDELSNSDKLETFTGHLLKAYPLRNQATKLGYIRGSTEDGGCFYCYEKRFPSLNLSSVIEFSGNQLPEENNTVALLNLSFFNQQQKVPLNKIPKVLLSECYQDICSIAAQGSGFDADWEKKVWN